ncbi:kinase-like protein [Neocallimastix lanati (nom. inval.)]|jgi:tau tubulin kinase|uniref:non-specific serine/threonine protein kinase n=1 Tax=Neocallimastix californiae TaxID=1754190 RepID=A0A1Y2AC92_9FUNG|nr:kinase-like protein [Neocallimastix sp. JGI-2020a]ORY20183.1 kinase-like protein [Neocallimastix californiae]|eukprot:ORY20183.1 kinase-like protein [Neocallimastix californiae]
MLKSIIIKKRWKILDTIGKGAFGELFSAYDMENQNTVAIKVEGPLTKNKRKRALLAMEISVLRKMQSSSFVCRFEACGRITIQSSTSSTTYDYMVMQLLGPSLSKLRRKCKKFSLATTALLGKQMLNAIKDCHTIGGVIHRDIKPGNFCIDNSNLYNGRARCYIIDFGLCRPYISSSGEIKEARRSVGFRGTAAYASINAHDGKDLGRVDDLWSLFYVLVEFMIGDLPWKGREKEQVAIYKRQMTNSYLVANLPSPFNDMLQYLKTLKFEDEPDYDLLDSMMDELFRISGKSYDVPYDWELARPIEDQSNNYENEPIIYNNNNNQLIGYGNEGNNANIYEQGVNKYYDNRPQMAVSSPTTQNAILTPPYSPIYSNGCVSPYKKMMSSPNIITASPIEHKNSSKGLFINPNHDINHKPLNGDVKIPATATLTRLLNEDSTKNVKVDSQKPNSNSPNKQHSNPRFLKFLIPN